VTCAEAVHGEDHRLRRPAIPALCAPRTSAAARTVETVRGELMIDFAMLGGLGLLSVAALVLIAMSRRPPRRRSGRRRQKADMYAR
jgi:hypothetical protein